MNSKNKQLFEFEWNDIGIVLEFYPDWSPSFHKVYGYPLVHLMIQAEDSHPLPITKTGFHSTYLPAPALENHESPVAYVRDWLDAYADSEEWKIAEQTARQGTLF